jgi:hypothetical protein
MTPPARPDAATWAKALQETFLRNAHHVDTWRTVAETALALHAQAVAAVREPRVPRLSVDCISQGCPRAEYEAKAIEVEDAEVAQAVQAEREAIAQMADAIVTEHRDRQREVYGEERVDANDGVLRVHTETTALEVYGPRCGEPGYFCEDFGCGSFEDFAMQIRARGPQEGTR